MQVRTPAYALRVGDVLGAYTIANVNEVGDEIHVKFVGRISEFNRVYQRDETEVVIRSNLNWE